MAMTGMDIQQVRTLAQRLQQGADQINQLSQQLTAALGSTPWEGQDKQKFVNDWNSQHRTALSRIVQSLHDASATATRNASEQEQVSSR